ncbi:MAG: glycosyltransferase family 4 protein [Thermoleophilia bacterium]
MTDAAHTHRALTLGAPRRLRIGIIAPAWVPVPPPAYGGIEQVIATLAEGLVRRGHHVRMVAAPGSSLPGVECITPLDELPASMADRVAEWRHALAAGDAVADCDVVIDNAGLSSCALLRGATVPVLHVVHGHLDDEQRALYHATAASIRNIRFIAVSRAQRMRAPGLPWAGVCHNGMRLDDVPFRDGDDGYLAFLGRMSPDKGVVHAIEIARRAGMPLHIAAKCREPEERAYFERHVAPHIGDGVVWLGELGTPDKYRVLSNARALVFPIRWDEPFGMVMIEAMACGTPVLATNRGAVPEVVTHGVTGFIAENAELLGQFVPRLGELDPVRCRADVKARFGADALVDRYEALLRDSPRAIVRRPARLRPVPSRPETAARAG